MNYLMLLVFVGACFLRIWITMSMSKIFLPCFVVVLCFYALLGFLVTGCEGIKLGALVCSIAYMVVNAIFTIILITTGKKRLGKTWKESDVDKKNNIKRI